MEAVKMREKEQIAGDFECLLPTQKDVVGLHVPVMDPTPMECIQPRYSLGNASL
jgi:hypothetical protein